MTAHKEQVKTLFSQIAPHYDLGNNILSLGIYKTWYKKLMNYARVDNGIKILDCATGTANLAIEFKKAVGKDCQVIGMDYCPEMLEIGKEKVRKSNLDIILEEGDALNIKYPDNTFDIASIAFGIRNVSSIERCLIEMNRVVKPGGKVIVLEFGQPTGLFHLLFNFYSNVILKNIGLLISKNRKAYNYLVSTSAKFPCREEFIKIMESSASFSECNYKSLSFGIVYLYIGTKIND